MVKVILPHLCTPGEFSPVFCSYIPVRLIWQANVYANLPWRHTKRGWDSSDGTCRQRNACVRRLAPHISLRAKRTFIYLFLFLPRRRRLVMQTRVWMRRRLLECILTELSMLHHKRGVSDTRAFLFPVAKQLSSRFPTFFSVCVCVSFFIHMQPLVVRSTGSENCEEVVTKRGSV